MASRLAIAHSVRPLLILKTMMVMLVCWSTGRYLNMDPYRRNAFSLTYKKSDVIVQYLRSALWRLECTTNQTQQDATTGPVVMVSTQFLASWS